MRAGRYTRVAAAALLTPRLVFAVDTSDDRIAISLNGTTLPRTNGGGGGSLGWQHNFDAETLAGIAAEHQEISVARWTFGSVNGLLTRGPANARYSFYGEAHEGAGDDGPKAFKYNIEALGLIGTWFRRFSLQLEDRQIEVEKTHGNLPKVGASYLWNRHVYTTVSHVHSISGNLGTHLTSGRIDLYSARLNYLAGVSYGQASPAILGLGFTRPGQTLKEVYGGVTKPFPRVRGDLGLIVDYQDLAGSPRFAVTLNYIFHVGHRGKPQ
jgi:hypothetical protein